MQASQPALARLAAFSGLRNLPVTIFSTNLHCRRPRARCLSWTSLAIYSCTCVMSQKPVVYRHWANCPRPRLVNLERCGSPGGAGPGGGHGGAEVRAGHGAQLCCCFLRRDGDSRLAAARPRAVNATRSSSALPARPPAGTW